MMFQFFWSRTASVWIAILYMALGLPLLPLPLKVALRAGLDKMNETTIFELLLQYDLI